MVQTESTQKHRYLDFLLPLAGMRTTLRMTCVFKLFSVAQFTYPRYTMHMLEHYIVRVNITNSR